MLQARGRYEAELDDDSFPLEYNWITLAKIGNQIYMILLSL